MVNGLGVVGWGVGGIEAEAAMLGQPARCSFRSRRLQADRPIAGWRDGDRPVLTITEALRKKGVVGTFVGVLRAGLEASDHCGSRHARQHVPEYGATVAIFPIDDMTLDYLASDRPRPDPDCAGRGLREGAGALPHDATPDAKYATDH
jgi:aconitate hydratase